MHTSNEQKIVQHIVELTTPSARDRIISEVRIGLVYTSVRLDNGDTGIAWTAREGRGCSHQQDSGTLAGQQAADLLGLMESRDNPLFRSIGLATANALTAGMSRLQTLSMPILDLLDIQSSDHVTMVGLFRPLVPRIRRTGCRLDILELKTDEPGTLSPEQGRSSLAACDIAIITATSIVTATMDELLSQLGNVRAAVILGPSTFMRPEAYAGKPVSHIAGARVINPKAVERIVSEGGGTHALKSHLQFETICINP